MLLQLFYDKYDSLTLCFPGIRGDKKTDSFDLTKFLDNTPPWPKWDIRLGNSDTSVNVVYIYSSFEFRPQVLYIFGKLINIAKRLGGPN